MNITEYIKNQLLFNDHCTLPGLGSFEIIKIPSKIEGRTVKPPTTDVHFNTEKSLDDGALSRAVSSAEEIPEEESSQRVLEFIDDILFKLNKGEKFEIEGFGKLYRDPENVIRFEKEPSFIIESDISGLESFELDALDENSEIQDLKAPGTKKTIQENQTEPADEKVQGTLTSAKSGNQTGSKKNKSDLIIPDDREVKETKNNRSIAWILTGAAMVILASLIVLKMFTTLLDTTSLRSIDNTQMIDDEAFPEDDYYEEDVNPELSKALDSMVSQENALNVTEEKEDVSTAPQGEFHIIAGSFKDNENASRLQHSLTEMGYQAVIIRQGNNLFRVSAMSFRDKESGMTELKNFREKTRNNAAWLLDLKE